MRLLDAVFEAGFFAGAFALALRPALPLLDQTASASDAIWSMSRPESTLFGFAFQNIELGRRLGFVVAMLDQQPVLAAVAGTAAHANERPTSLEFLAVEAEFEFALLQSFFGVDFRLPGALVPDHYRAAAVFALRNDAFEIGVVDRMIFDLHGERFYGRVETGAFGNGPAFECAVVFEPEVVVKAAGGVLLDDVTAGRCRSSFCRRRARAFCGSRACVCIL